MICYICILCKDKTNSSRKDSTGQFPRARLSRHHSFHHKRVDASTNKRIKLDNTTETLDTPGKLAAHISGWDHVDCIEFDVK